MPNPIPVMLLKRLAVDLAWQGHGIRKALLRDAVLRTANMAQLVGVKALMVHALSESAQRYYDAHGFDPSPIHPRTLFLHLAAPIAEQHRPS
jgi:GNAT superfamily N-acetyltransferase